jgi:hypothetical protein
MPRSHLTDWSFGVQLQPQTAAISYAFIHLSNVRVHNQLIPLIYRWGAIGTRLANYDKEIVCHLLQ